MSSSLAFLPCMSFGSPSMILLSLFLTADRSIQPKINESLQVREILILFKLFIIIRIPFCSNLRSEICGTNFTPSQTDKTKCLNENGHASDNAKLALPTLA